MPSESVNKRLKRLEQKVARVSPTKRKPYYMSIDRKLYDEAMASARESLPPALQPPAAS